jgi:beta-N-acetylhexosaminidase
VPPSASPSAARPTLEERIAGLLVVGFRGDALPDAAWVREALADRGLGGVILFDRDQLTGKPRNIVSPAQVRRLTAELRAAAGDRPIVVAVDQEGGVVTRLSPAHGFPAVASQATIGAGTASAARAWARALATTLADSGFDLNFAPVVDLDVNPDSPAIGALHRSFSADPDVVVAMATIEIDAHRAAGVRTTLKHFPGIGSSTTNTDFGVADVTKTWSRAELEPFRRLVAAGKADLVMAGHVVNGQLDADRPASLSRAIVTDLLRGELGWDGVVVTDDLGAAAITETFGADEAVLLALEAGNDLLLFANQAAYDPAIVERVVGIVAAAVRSGRIPESRIDEALDRVQAVLPAPS